MASCSAVVLHGARAAIARPWSARSMANGAITSVSNPDRDASRLANVVFSVDETEVAVPPHAESRA